MPQQSFKALLGLAALALATPSASAIDIQFDYLGNSFFTSGSQDSLDAIAALEAAASDLESAILTTLDAQGDSVIGTGSSGSTFTIDASLSFASPSNEGVTVEREIVTLGPDVFQIFVGSRDLGPNTTDVRTLGRGGPLGYDLSFNASGTESGIQQAAANASDLADDEFYRTENGPLLARRQGDLDFGGGLIVPFDFRTGPSYGSLAFDAGSNAGDPIGFHYDHTTAVPSGLIDFYSVALHEILHTLGIGTYESWDANVSGDDWLGEAVQALLNEDDENNLVEPGHIADSVIGRTLATGDLQEAVMGPSISAGQRLFLTDVDLAFLTDIGWTTVAVPEPSLAMGLAGMGALGLLRRRRVVAA